ncbi:MAG TPA: antibiotic biosynthesis monooxygenase [Myxococcota bacterium]|nr:antibiotic biosynthesis monooxygenase [Myxococcota bacterium]
MTPLLVLAEFGCTEAGAAELRAQLDRTLTETRGVAGCLQATVWERPAERRFLFVTMWTDAEAVGRWVENDFHRAALMPAFRKWCTEGSFSEFAGGAEHARARKCASCGRWTQATPGWSEAEPSRCRECGTELTPKSVESEGESLEARVRSAVVAAALAAYEDAAIRGVCHEGAWEAAVGAMRTAALRLAPRGPGAPS